MATGQYSLYQANGVTPIATPQPSGATWETVQRGVFSDGTQRVALGKRVVWTYASPLTPAQYQTLVQSRLAGRQTVETWKRPTGVTGGTFVMTTAQMQETIPGVLSSGEYHNVSVTFTDVREL